MSPRVIWIVFRKEILDIIRDRRTLIFMIAMPLLAIPVLIHLMSSFMIGSAISITEQNSRVALVGAADAGELADFLQNRQRTRLEPPGDGEIDIFVVERMSEANAFLEVRTDVEDVAAAQEMIKNRELDAAVVVPPGFAGTLADGEVGSSLRIDYLSTNERSEKAQSRLSRSLGLFREEVVRQRLGDSFALTEPFETAHADLATSRERAGEVFGRFLPYIIILMTFTGGIFPATSLAAGEKEQKTLETLLASPASRIELVTGKFLVIMATGIISAFLALTGMYYAFSFGEIGRRMRESFALHMDAASIALAGLLVVPLAIFFAGLLLTLSVFARSFREAQSYISPLSFLIIIPAFTSFLPGVELNTTLSLVPIVNVSLVLKEILAGRAMEVLPYFGLTLASTLVIASLAIWLCAAMFKREGAIFKV